LSLTCGLRMGESLGLKWTDINLDAGTLRVNRQLQRIREGGGLVFSEPKNASRRTIDLPQRALEALRLHSKRQAEEKRLGRRITRTQGSFSPHARAPRWTPST
jgi:integrase